MLNQELTLGYKALGAIQPLFECILRFCGQQLGRL
jgi:hypothetical protein